MMDVYGTTPLRATDILNSVKDRPTSVQLIVVNVCVLFVMFDSFAYGLFCLFICLFCCCSFCFVVLFYFVFCFVLSCFYSVLFCFVLHNLPYFCFCLHSFPCFFFSNCVLSFFSSLIWFLFGLEASLRPFFVPLERCFW